MNETSATSASGMSLLPDGIATLTAIHFTIIAVVAVLVVIGLIWGIKAKRSRVKASRDVIANAREAGVAPVPASVPVESPRAQAPEPAPAAPQRAEPRRAEQSQTQTRTVASTPAPSPSPSPSIERTAPAAAPQPPIIDEPAPAPAAAPTPLAPSPVPEQAEPAPAEPAPIATPVSAQSYADGPVTQLKGLGPKVATQLGALGVTTVGQMAALSESEAQSIDAQLGNFTGRMGRDRCIDQARLLAAGDTAGFEAVFGKL